jgi:hypothetical protein
MKIFRDKKLFTHLCFFSSALLIILIVGCGARPTSAPSEIASPVKNVRISALTEFVQDSSEPQIKALVELSDAKGGAIRALVTFRFEFYEFQPVSSDLRGRRLVIWPAYDLSDERSNQKHWNNFLRGYEFLLPLDFMLHQDNKYVLEVTCLLGQKRYSDLFKMEYQP